MLSGTDVWKKNMMGKNSSKTVAYNKSTGVNGICLRVLKEVKNKLTKI